MSLLPKMLDGVARLQALPLEQLSAEHVSDPIRPFLAAVKLPRRAMQEFLVLYKAYWNARVEVERLERETHPLGGGGV